jgi:ABC-type uncharacterized transport system substrate-binding protein
MKKSPVSFFFSWMSKGSLLFGLLFSGAAFSHPHAWVDTQTYIESNDTHITVLHMTWAFDAETSNYMLQGEDVSPANINETLHALAASVVGNMYNEHYFTYLYDGNTPVRYKEARYAQFVKDKDKLVLTFEIPLSDPIAFKGKNLKLYIYDETYFVDMSWLNKQDVKLSDQLTSQCTGEIIAPKASDEQRAYTLSLASDVAPDNRLGQLFSQKYQLNCKK